MLHYWARIQGLLLFACLFPLPVLADAPPNFIFISVDDLNNYVSFLQEEKGNFIQKIYPDPQLRQKTAQRLTPNLDKLARQSMIFTRAYCPQALCGPSRTAMLTGVPPHVSGYTDHDRHFRHHEGLADTITLPQHLKQNGYFTAGVGKIFHKAAVNFQNGMSQDWPDRLFSWSHWVDRPIGVHTRGKNHTQFSPYSPEDRYMNFGLTFYNPEETHDYTNARFVADLLTKGNAEITDTLGNLHSVRLPEDQPYFIACGIFAPHMPWSVPQSFYDRFPVEEMNLDADLRAWTEKDLEDVSDFAIREFVKGDVPMLDAMGEQVHGPGQGHLEAWRAAVQAYLATIAYADYCLGQLVDAIETNPRRETTVVVLHSDHGWHLGDKFRYRKHCLWEQANHSVLIIRDPGYPQATNGTRCDQPVSLQDLYPTLALRAGLEVPSHVHGHDLAPLLEDPGDPNWDPVILRSYQEGNASIRTPKALFIRYRDGSRELYDLVEDPWEYSNLVRSPAYRGLLQQMEALLDERLAWSPEQYR
jgi:arylsulfatase A-like enzyme